MHFRIVPRTLKKFGSLKKKFALKPELVFLLYWKHLPESPRWLLLQGRYEEAQTIIEKAAKVNGSVGGEFKLKLEPQETVVKPSRLNEFKLLLSSWYLLRSTLIIWASWMCLSGAYYGDRCQIMPRLINLI